MISPPPDATRIWVETRENMPPHDQSHVLPPEMHAYFANGTMMGRVPDAQRDSQRTDAPESCSGIQAISSHCHRGDIEAALVVGDHVVGAATISLC